MSENRGIEASEIKFPGGEQLESVWEAAERTVTFIDRFYSSRDKVPQRVSERLARLETSPPVTINNSSLESRLNQAGYPPVLKKHKQAVYSPPDDRIYCRENISFRQLVHEMLHFVSKEGLKIASDEEIFEKEEENEITTELLVRAAEHNLNWRLNMSPQEAVATLIKLGRISADQKSTTEPVLALSYQTWLDNFIRQLSERKELRNLLPSLAQYYFEADGLGFREHLKQLLGERDLAVFEEKVREYPAKESTGMAYVFTRYAEELSKSSTMPQEIKNLAAGFMKILKGEDKRVVLGFVYPEEAKSLVRIIPAIPETKLKPKIAINLGWHGLYDDQNFRQEYFQIVQGEAYVLWQAIKLATAAKGGEILDKDFYDHPQMRAFLNNISLGSLAETEKMAYHFFGAKMPDGVREEILKAKK